MDCTFPKSEHLCKREWIKTVRQQGKCTAQTPILLFSLPTNNPTQVLIYVPKRLFKHATDRNLLKRRMREAYRINKNLLKQTFLLQIQYQATEKLPFAAIEASIKQLLTDINND